MRPDGVEAERALSQALGKSWSRGQIYGRSRRIGVEKTVPDLLDRLAQALGPLAEHVRVAPEDPAQTKWDAVGNLAPLPESRRQVAALWLVDVLQSGSLFVEFQPIFDLTSGDILGFEGLLRGRGSDGGTRLAADLFPAARRLGIELPFERLSWTLVLEAAARLPEPSMLFLNVNPTLLTGTDTGLSMLGAEAERVNFPYARLALDLVEIERVDLLDRLALALGVPHDLGVSIALDDITSGYGTIKYCAGLSPRWIKVDSGITRGIASDPRRRAVLRLLSEVGRDGRVGLIAEGIEEPEDLDVCVNEGVLAAQGYFLARPSVEPGAASPEFTGWLAARRSDAAPAPPEERGGETARAERGGAKERFEL
ncbi:MAG TPA: EAL domain-containing protein [Thermoanaerobaculia bacterium]|nr:EAL domain-containing protein [Thermoanaerobaculia bacterium]